MKFLLVLATLVSANVFAQSDYEMNLCLSAANKAAAKLVIKTNDVRIGNDYCQANSQGVVGTRNGNLVIRNWVSCHYGQGRVVDVELRLGKSWILNDTVCKVKDSYLVND